MDFITKLSALTRDILFWYSNMKLKEIENEREAPTVKSRLYENTEVRYNNALFYITHNTQLMSPQHED